MSTQLLKQPRSGDRKGLRSIHLIILLVTTSAPITVLSGGISTSMQASGVLGIPLIFIVMAVMLLAFSAAYGAMAKHFIHAGGFYAYLARAIGPSAGLGTSAVAIFGYNSMAIGIHGLFGAVFVGTLEAKTGVSLPWWLPVVIAIVVIGALGTRGLRVSVWVTGVLTALQLVAMLVFDFSAIASPGPDGYSFAALDPASLLGGSVAVAVSFTFAAWVGVETAAAYGEELRTPARSIVRATVVTIVFLGVLYTASAWALSVGAGPSQVVAQATELGTEQVPTEVASRLGAGFGDLFNALLVASLFATALCFHNAGARQLSALSRDGALPAALGRRDPKSGAPALASLIQAGIAVVVILIFAVLGTDPVIELFTWLSNLGAVCVLLLLTLASLAAIVHLLRSDYEEGSFFGWEGPVVAAFFTFVTFGALFGLSCTQFDRLIGVPSDSFQAWFLPGMIPVVFLGGVIVGRVLKMTRPDVAARIGLPADRARHRADDLARTVSAAAGAAHDDRHHDVHADVTPPASRPHAPIPTWDNSPQLPNRPFGTESTPVGRYGADPYRPQP